MSRLLRFATQNSILLILLAISLTALIETGRFRAFSSTTISDASTQQQRTQRETVKSKPSRTLGSGPAVPAVPTITATLTDNVATGTKVLPGSTINYTVTINNSGTDATSVNFSDTVDVNTSLVAGSVHASPIAFNDTYNCVGYTFLDTSARPLPSATANDVTVNPAGATDTFSVTTLTNAATSLGRTVTLGSNGHFTYTPPVGRPNAADGASVNDSFTYTLTNS